MATAKETIAAALRGEECLGRAADDEEVFVLRAQDESAPTVVRRWATWNMQTLSPKKLKDALDLADRMEAWPARKKPT